MIYETKLLLTFEADDPVEAAELSRRLVDAAERAAIEENGEAALVPEGEPARA